MAESVNDRCKCKRGRCPKCGARCKRCGCGCDGTPPHIALQRQRGHRGRDKFQQANYRDEKRQAAKAANAAARANRKKKAGPLTDVDDVFDAFEINPSERAHMPGKKARYESPDSANSRHKACLSRVVEQSALRVASILFPSDPQAVLEHTAVKMLSDRPSAKRRSSDDDGLATALATIMGNLPPRSLQRRVARAALVKGLGKDRLKEVALLHGLAPSLYNGGGTRLAAYADFAHLSLGQLLTKRPRFIQRFDPAVMKKAVEFILHPTNVSTLSWGTRVIKLTKSDFVTIPSLIRRKDRKQMWDEYKASIPSTDASLGRTSFFLLASNITKSSPKLLKAVDYVTGELLNDTTETLQDLIDAFGGDRKDELTTHLNVARNFLKVQYDTHAMTCDDAVPTHGVLYGLKKPLDTTSGDTDAADEPNLRQGEQKCSACSFI